MALFIVQEIEGNYLRFDSEVSHHLLHSVRKRVGDEISATDGKGRILNARITGTEGKTVEALIVSDEKPEKEIEIIVGCSLIKKESRFETFLEKATELGAAGIIPMICDRTLKPSLRLDRSGKIISSAAQQAFNPYLPVLESPMDFVDLIHHNKWSTYERFIATAVDRREVKTLEEICTGHQPVIVLIGPEGDFTEEEKSKAVNAGWKPVSLGTTRLRTETAAIMAVQIVKSCYQLKKKRT